MRPGRRTTTLHTVRVRKTLPPRSWRTVSLSSISFFRLSTRFAFPLPHSEVSTPWWLSHKVSSSTVLNVPSATVVIRSAEVRPIVY